MNDESPRARQIHPNLSLEEIASDYEWDKGGGCWIVYPGGRSGGGSVTPAEVLAKGVEQEQLAARLEAAERPTEADKELHRNDVAVNYLTNLIGQSMLEYGFNRVNASIRLARDWALKETSHE